MTKFKSIVLVVVLTALAPIADANNRWWEDKDFQEKYCDVVSLFAGAYRIRSVFSGAGDKIQSTENAVRSGCMERQRQNAPRAETLPASYRNPACPLYLQQQVIADALKYGIAVVEAFGQTSGMSEHTAFGARCKPERTGIAHRAKRRLQTLQDRPFDEARRVLSGLRGKAVLTALYRFTVGARGSCPPTPKA